MDEDGKYGLEGGGGGRILSTHSGHQKIDFGFFLSGTSYEFPYHEAGNPDVLICSDLFHRQRGNGGKRKEGEGDVFCPSFLLVLLLFKKSDSLLPVGEISLRPLLLLLPLLLLGDCCCCCWASHVGGEEEGKY